MAKSPAKEKLHLSVVVEPEQLRAWNKAAKRDARTLSSWVRLVLDKNAEEAK